MEEEDLLIIDLESNREDIFLALYLGLSLVKGIESARSARLNKDKPEKDQQFSMIGAEAFCLLKEFEKSHPKLFQKSKDWVDENYLKK